jgi:putative membrane protein
VSVPDNAAANSKPVGASSGSEPASAQQPAPNQNTLLALDRTYLASERTLLAWVRTALSMISFGFTLGKIGQAIQEVEFKGLLHERTYGVKNIAYFLVILGILSLAGAIAQHFIRVRGLYALGFSRQFSIALASAGVLAVVGLFALTSLVLQL